MPIDLSAARDFMATHARVLDRRRFELLDGGGDPAAALAALDGYGNPDGGYGWGLEGDLRSPESQPAAALHAFEVLHEVAPATTPRTVALCDWLERETLPDGGLPMALPMAITAGSGPWWRGRRREQLVAADHHAWWPPGPGRSPATTRPSRATPGSSGRPASAWTRSPPSRRPRPPMSSRSRSSSSTRSTSTTPRPRACWPSSAHSYPPDGRLRVHGGSEDEVLPPLSWPRDPDRPARALLAEHVVEADLDRLAAGQQHDGGWTVDFRSESPAGSLDWRGYATVDAIAVLRANGRIPQ